jgi:phosphoglycolate phosphatase
LYYGLFTDTCGLTEIFHPLDKDMRDILAYNKIIVKSLQNTNLSLAELNIAGAALNNCFINTELRYAIFKSEPCDPNILGFISDLALQVDGVDTCVVYNVISDGAKLSVRCCARDVMAADFAEFLTCGVGSGGGHLDKAGGFISAAKIETSLDDFIRARTLEYFTSYDIVDSAAHNLDFDAMKRYKKLKLTVGYACSADVFPKGTPLSIRALEGDENIIASDEIYLMVGILGEIYPIKAEKFRNCYIEAAGAFDIKIDDLDYSPTVRNIITGEVREVTGFIKPCTATGEVYVFAKRLERYTKVFTAWNLESYMYGREGDYIVARSDSPNDVYIIRSDIFCMTYEPA